MADPICPTFAAGTYSLENNVASVLAFNDDSAKPGQPNGYRGQYHNTTAGSFNNGWANEYLTQTKGPTYSSAGLNSFGNTGLQS